MEQTEKKLSEFTTTELKSIAYDQLAQIEVAQNNLRNINAELVRRAKPAEEKEEKTE